MRKHTTSFRRFLPALALGSAVVMGTVAEQPVSAQVPVNPQPQVSRAPQVVLKMHTLTDAGSGNMPSHTVLAPSGWTVTGGAWWPAPNFFNILPSQDITITAPDGRVVRLGPSIGATDFRPNPALGIPRPAEGTADNGYPVIYMPGSLEEWRQWIQTRGIPSAYPKATNIRVEPVTVLPEFTTILQRQLAPFRQQQALSNQQSQAMGINMRQFMDCAVMSAMCSYDLDGRRYEEMSIFGVFFFGSDSDMGRSLSWGVEPNVSFRAPAGQLESNMALMMSIANSLQMTPQWHKMKVDHQAKMAQISAKGAADRSRIIADSNREISRMINEGYQQRQASQDRAHHNFIKAIREVEEYTTPGSETKVQLPHYYEHVYTNKNGEYILTNDSNYNPNIDPAFNNHTWDPMQIAK